MTPEQRNRVIENFRDIIEKISKTDATDEELEIAAKNAAAGVSLEIVKTAESQKRSKIVFYEDCSVDGKQPPVIVGTINFNGNDLFCETEDLLCDIQHLVNRWTKKCCECCVWRHDEVCVNDKSDECADFVSPYHHCEGFEEIFA